MVACGALEGQAITGMAVSQIHILADLGGDNLTEL